MKTQSNTQLRQWAALCLAVVACLLITPSAHGFAGGNGTKQDPYQIATAEHLDAVRDHLDAHFVQNGHIDLGDPDWSGGAGWVPIGGTGAGERFSGSYDGGGFAIRNLRIDRPSTTHVGLFRYLDGAAVRNVMLENADVRGSTHTGTLAGLANASSIEHLEVEGAVVGGGDCGGIVGLANGGHVSGASFSGAVQGGTNTGGLAGRLSGGVRMRHAASTGTVTGNATVGGVVGYLDQSEISDCYSQAAVSAVAGGNAGGLAGYLYFGVARRGYSTGAVSASGSNAGGLIGAQFSSSVSDGHWDVDASGRETSAGGTGWTTAAMRSRKTYHNFNFTNLWQINEGVGYPVFRPLAGHSQPLGLLPDDLVGAGTEEDPYLITNADELDAMRHDRAAHYRLANDMDLAATVVWNAGLGWVPVGTSEAAPFTGSFDGAGFTIRNLTVNRPAGNFQSLLGYLAGARVRNLWIEDANVHGAASTGVLAGHAQAATMMNLRGSGEVSGQADSGGLIGRIVAGSLAHAAFTGTVKGSGNVGVLAGSIAGGADVRYGSSAGEARGSSNVGGLAGYLDQAMVADSHSRASVRGGTTAGGFVGHVYFASSWRCIGSGSVTGTVTNIGGFTGSSFSSTMSDCYWDIQTTGRLTGGPAGGGRTSVEMKQRATFLNFNFNTVWRVDEGVDYPLHQELAVTQEPAGLLPEDLGGEGTAGAPYLISSAAELAAMRHALDAHFKLTNDIDLASTVMWDHGRGWRPVGAPPTDERFRGTLDGAGFAIRNLTIHRPTSANQGLFGYLDGARIHDLRIENASVRGANDTGVLAGFALASTMENITADGEVTGATDCGGLLGRQNGGNLGNASFIGTVQASTNVGGLIGKTEGAATIRHAHSDGRVVGSHSVGGLLGYHYGHTLADSHSHAEVGGTNTVGGLIGYLYFSTAYRCFSTGPVSGAGSNVGGLVGGGRFHQMLKTAIGTLDDPDWMAVRRVQAGAPPR